MIEWIQMLRLFFGTTSDSTLEKMKLKLLLLQLVLNQKWRSLKNHKIEENEK